MEKTHYQVAPTKVSLLIDLNYQTRQYKFEGISRLEDSVTFFKPVAAWLYELEEVISNSIETSTTKQQHRFVFFLTYFNSASGKYVFEIMEILSKINSIIEDYKFHHDGTAPFSLVVDWLFEEGDEMMKEVGEEMQDITEFQFNFIEV
jgi:hypothetical protein